MSAGSTTTLSLVSRRGMAIGRLRDYVELTKPKIAVMALVTVVVGAVLSAWGPPEAWTLVHTLVGMALVAASGTSLNQWLEITSDSRMRRTASRPLPAGRLSSSEVLAFGLATVVAGGAYLTLLVNPAAAAVALLSWLIYVAIYTPLKVRSPLNTVVGAVAGALPVLVGWVAVGGRMNVLACTLFLIVYLWQFPHFMAIAWIYAREYDAAGMKMLTTVDPTGRRAARQAVWGALMLVPVSLVPCFAVGAGPWYLAWTLSLGVAYLVAAGHFGRRRDESSARRLLRVSLVYLPGVLLGLTLLPLI
jgi:protoheme IX farnesyltransferase